MSASLDWQDFAACTGRSELFFGPDGERDEARRAREKRAKAVCASCEVRAECLASVAASPEAHGVWAGLGETERRFRDASAGRQRRAADERAAVLAAGEKPCTKCGDVKPLGEFSPKGDWYSPWCRECRRADWHQRQAAA